MPPFWSSKKSKKLEVDTHSHSGGSISKSPSPAPEASGLRTQFPTYASSATKIRLSVLATALVDALGAPPEFHKRFEYPFVTSMLPNGNFNLPPGVWTDDTSMMLCLANSISTFKETADSPYTGGFDEVHQLEFYNRWHKEGYLSAVGRCFDIGNTVKRALQIFGQYSNPEEALLRIRSDLGGESTSGNGSLMRIIPIGLVYWRDESQAKSYARRSSQATHPSIMCVEACEMWTGLISLIMEEMNDPRPASERDPNTQFSKLNLLEYISNFPFTDNKLHEALTLPFGVPLRPEGRAEREQWYWRHHPLLRLIQETQLPANIKEPRFPYAIPPIDRLPSSGYVLHTSVAALYCFFATRTFEEGALMAVNLGDDADTVGAVYAGLAACWYAGEEGKAEEVFWTKRVREWRKALIKRELVERVAENLVAWERKQEDM
ncbi:unnamed protein product [Cyclocybe aegerita]|uniref:ADP-ribosylhydrolase ARH3 n=1 Tax=Cyclocybe aegerita TaxID=1973307 RepID=A0A8S0VSK5_CYCAE|nr:unnamed protein product [Cyclocybe aegerita]